MDFSDHGKQPYVTNIETLTKGNETFRTAIWTGEHLQMTLMSIEVGGDIGLEVHPDNDQFLRVEAGEAEVVMGPSRDNLEQKFKAEDDFGIFIPAGTWHNIINTGNEPLKLYSLYGPSHHEHGTIHQTRAEADEAEAAEHHA